MYVIYSLYMKRLKAASGYSSGCRSEAAAERAWHLAPHRLCAMSKGHRLYRLLASEQLDSIVMSYGRILVADGFWPKAPYFDVIHDTLG